MKSVRGNGETQEKEKRDNGEAGNWQEIEDGRRETGTLRNIITSRHGEGKDSGTKRNRGWGSVLQKKTDDTQLSAKP